MNEFVREKFTLAWLEKHVKSVDGCLVWVRSFTSSGQPYAAFRGAEGLHSIRVRRVVWEAAHERQGPAKMWAHATCGTHGCVHPDHIVMRPRSVAMKGTKRPESVKAKIAQTKRAASKWSQELLQELAASDKSNHELAKQYGFHHSTISKVRNGAVRVDYASPWRGLGAIAQVQNPLQGGR